jgi:dihydrofolate reductase
MKVVAYFAVSADGFIADEHDGVSWVSKASWSNYTKLVTDARFAIVGRRTYEMMKSDEFIDECRYLVLSSNQELHKKHENVEISTQPREALAKLKSQGHQCAAVIGGAHTFAKLMQEQLIEELYLDVEPVLLGKGVRLFEGEAGSLKLLETTLLPNMKTVQLHYGVTMKAHHPKD